MKFHFFVLLVLFCICSCKRKCEETVCVKNGKVAEYFDVFREGNWWVYENQDGLKKDSIYLFNHVEKNINYEFSAKSNKKACVYFSIENYYNVNSLFLTEMLSLNDLRFSTVFDTYKCDNIIDLGSAIKIDMQSNTFTYLNNSEDVPIVDNLMINGVKYDRVLKIAINDVQIYYEANLGIVCFLNEIDTFKIKNFFVN